MGMQVSPDVIVNTEDSVNTHKLELILKLHKHSMFSFDV